MLLPKSEAILPAELLRRPRGAIASLGGVWRRLQLRVARRSLQVSKNWTDAVALATIIHVIRNIVGR
jgi:hypothetical protein